MNWEGGGFNPPIPLDNSNPMIIELLYAESHFFNIPPLYGPKFQ